MKTVVVSAAAALALVLAGCGGSSSTAKTGSTATRAATAAPETPYTGYPDSIVVLGHSGSTGESSDPVKAVRVETRENSWVTGTNPKVDSLYQRILAVHPQIKGHSLSLSRGGATVIDALTQAHAAVAQRPRNAVVVIQLVDNDR